MPTDRLSDRPLTEPSPTRLPPDHPERDAILSLHAAAIADDRPGYVDPVSGLFVMTAATLRDRGSCCDNRCRHCPYTDG